MTLRRGLQKPPRRRLAVATCALVLLTGIGTAFRQTVMAQPVGNQQVDYLTRIKPLLSVKCYACHGALERKSGLRLETKALMLRGGEGGPVIVPGDASASALIDRITAGPDERMPPPHAGSPLTAEEIGLLKRWIDQGAGAPAETTPVGPRDHWAFRPLARPRVPAVRNTVWARTPLDAFVAAQHDLHQLTPQRAADRERLVRRLYFDLIGLPPPIGEITELAADPSPQWYERTVERLLGDPRHGERWARHWMDVWRYSDWWGYAGQLRNSQKHIWHWRDWIVESLNEDLPYDEMIRLMLAADELYPHDLQRLRATGYLARNYFLFNRNQWMDETVEHLGKGFLGLTLNCAKCHDHKYDPISQADYYAMRAFFEPYHVRVDVVPGQPDLEQDGIPRVYDGLLDEPTYLFIRGQENHPDKTRVITPAVPQLLATDELVIEPVSLPITAWQPERRPWVIDDQIAAARRRLAAAEHQRVQVRNKYEGSVAQTSDENAAELQVAEAALDAARAELASLQHRAAALRSGWQRRVPAALAAEDGDLSARGTDVVVPAAGSPDTTEEVSEHAAADAPRADIRHAIQADRRAVAARARHGLAVAELALLRAGDGKQPGAKQQRDQARQALAVAEQALEAPISAAAAVSPFPGAKWTPTRFRFSGKDDPQVEFHSRSTGRRTALAAWITDRRNPLTARVAANQIWLRHMGLPLVASVTDFGRNGSAPVHAELLDWLACELVDSGWNMKHLHRLIVNSAVYRLDSSLHGRQQNMRRDPDNLHWWRRSPIRVESQLVRDAILAQAGWLDSAMGGPAIPADQQDQSRRRSVYFFHSNNHRHRFLTAFDEATVKECYQREQSIRPQQALALTNSRFVLDAAGPIAARLSEFIGADPANPDADRSFVRSAFRLLLGAPASRAEVEASLEALKEWRRGAADDSRPAAGQQAWANLVWALINHNDFVTLR